MKKLSLLLPLIVILGLGCSRPTPAPTPQPGPIACTMEARMCPDGSYVGRSGPNCEFKACPSTPSVTSTPTATTTKSLYSPVIIREITITPLQVLEDSRCAVDVQCIWAGTVRLRATLTSGSETQEVTLTLGERFNFAGKKVTLVDVSPPPRSQKTIAPGDYYFSFTVTQ